ncbi:MAG: flagellar filament capping protein FliD [Pseudomonadales bacterium]|nr:flagellar filament capping protein FliD [Pseudomonadales bacterium]
MTSFSSLGVGSGLELQTLLDTLVANERQSYTAPLDKQATQATEKISAYGLLKSSASLFNNSMTDLASVDSLESRKAISSNPSSFSVTASATADAATLSIEINSIGQRQSLQASSLVDATNTAVSDVSTAIGGGLLTITTQQGDQFLVTVDADQSTLADIAAAINGAADNPGIEATVVNADSGPVLVLNAADTGTAHQMTLSVSDDDSNNTDAIGLSQLAFDSNNSSASSMQLTLDAENAEIFANSQLISSISGSVFTDVIEGVSITALSETTAAETATISKNTQNIVDNLDDFVKSFNDLNKTINDLGNAGVGDDSAGLLVGDSLLRSLSAQLRSTIFTQHKALPAGVQTLSDVGIRFDREGDLSLDQAKLDGVLATNFEDVVQLLTANDADEEVFQTYKTQLYSSVDDVVVLDGQITFTSNGDQFSFYSSAALGNSSLQGLSDAINNAPANDFIQSMVVNDVDLFGNQGKGLVITALNAGSVHSFQIEVSTQSTGLIDVIDSVAMPVNVSPYPQQQGAFVALQGIMAGFLGGSGEQGMIDTRTTGLSTELERIQSRREVQDDRLLSYEENLKVRFSALDLMVSNLNSQGEFLLDQLKMINKAND